jgi:hypothetical protein
MSETWEWRSTLQWPPGDHPHERMAERLNQLFESSDDGTPAMRRLLDEFPAATVNDWATAIFMRCSKSHGGPGKLVQYLTEIFGDYPGLTVSELIEAAMLARERRRQ